MSILYERLFSSIASTCSKSSFIAKSEFQKEYKKIEGQIKSFRVNQTIPSHVQMFAELNKTDFSELKNELKQNNASLPK